MPDQVRHNKLESDPNLFLPVIADLIRNPAPAFPGCRIEPGMTNWRVSLPVIADPIRNPCPRISWMPDQVRHDKLESDKLESDPD
jgi:hypothetical protein